VLSLFGRLVPGEHFYDPLTDTAQVDPQTHQDLSGNALPLTHQAEEKVLCPDVLMAELAGLASRQLQHLPGSGGKGRGPNRPPSRADGLFYLGSNSVEADPK
jgi:hypothetical protein